MPERAKPKLPAEIIVGIDLGTTNSEVAIVEDGRPRVLLVDGDPILPSVVGLAEDGRLLVGKAARNQAVIAPERTARSVKRKMGEDTVITLGTQSFRPQEISAMVLRKLREVAEAELGRPVGKAVITVPAYFNDTQRQATREAGQLAGLEVVRILNEPTAAALTYAPNPQSLERFLVYDLGGGTFDVSVVQAEGGVFEVLASHGDTHLGGDDLDELLADEIADEFEELFAVDLRANAVSKARLLAAAEAAKRHLSDHPFVRIEEEFIAEKDGVPLHLSTELDRSRYEELILPLMERTLDCVQRSLDDSSLAATQIGRVVLVGGSTRTPLVGRLLEERLGQPVHREVHPDLCVALGAAVQAAIVGKQNVGAVLVDITPHSLGIKTLEYPDDFGERVNEFKFTPIVARNAPLPATRSEVFCTVTDGQPTVEIDLYQGESGDVRRNHRVGKFMVEGLARVPAGNQIVVQLDLTLDGTLKVSAREKSTGLLKQITIENAMARFALEEREAARARLDRLWDAGGEESPGEEDGGDGDELGEAGHPKPRFKMPPAAPVAEPGEGQREAVQARALLEKASRLRGAAAEEDRAELDRLTGKIQAALAERQWQRLTQAMHELTDVLFYLEDS